MCIVKFVHGEGEERGKIKSIIRQLIFHLRHGWQVVVDEDLAVGLEDTRSKVLKLDGDEITCLFDCSSFVMRIVVGKAHHLAEFTNGAITSKRFLLRALAPSICPH